MPDLDQLLDALATEAMEGTRAPGAPTAIRQARRRRNLAVGAAAAAALVAVGIGAVTLGGSDRTSPTRDRDTAPAASASPTVVVSVTATPGSVEYFTDQVRRTLAEVPGWAPDDGDATLLNPCAGNWSGPAAGGSGGSFGIVQPGAPPSAWNDLIFFDSPAEATKHLARLVENLESCTQVTWQTQPIGDTGAVLASSPGGVAWIHRKDGTISTLQVPTADGPPPLDVQVEVADLLRESIP